MRKLFLVYFIILLFSSSSLNAQELKEKYNWGTSLTAAIIPMPTWTFGIQLGIEYWFNRRLSLLTDFTFRIGRKNSSDSEALNKKYFRIKPELRYYLFDKAQDINGYAGIQFSHSYRSFESFNGFFYNGLSGDSVYYFSKASVKSPVTTISFQFGLMMEPEKRVTADIFFGFGLRFVHTTHSNIVNQRAGMRVRAADWFTLTNSYEREGSHLQLYFNAGMRFIYNFCIK